MSKFLDAFISYGRADSKLFVTQLHQQLTDLGLKVWFDQHDIPLAVDFQEQINDGIEKSHNFLFVIAPHSVNSPYCAKEVELALRRNKRIIPILHVEQISREIWQQRNPKGTDADWEAYQAKGLHSSFSNLHPAIGKINWLNFRSGIDDFETSLASLLKIFDRDREYVHQHSLFLCKAIDWEKQQKQSRYLLIGEERQQAEAWLRTRFYDRQSPCIPTDLHCEFITESIKNANNLMTHVFLSYAEEDKLISQQIRNCLMREGLTVWTNKTDIQTGAIFLEAIKQGIEESDNIVYLMSPAALQSQYCREELDYAVSLHKRIIPILVHDVEPEQLPLALRKLQYIDLTDNLVTTDYQQDESQLIKTIRQDAAYHEEHKILLSKALKWERQHRNPSILLRGYNLRHAEAWLKVTKTKTAYPPIPLQEAFIHESLQQPPVGSLDVFISYSRADSDFARKLNDALQVPGKKTWFDQESIATGTDFQKEIYQGIESSDNFLFVLSPRSINSPYCTDEVEYAAKLNKRFVPVLYREVNPADLHPELAKVQWVDFHQSNGDFYASFTQLLRTLDTDREHVRSHTKWSQRAIEWEQKDYSEDLLLRGTELAIAINWLQEAERHGKQPPPTGLQKALITASEKLRDFLLKQEQERQQRELKTARQIMLRVMAALIAMTGLAALAAAQWYKAEKGQITALTQTSEARFALNRNSLDALIKAIEAGQHLKRLPWGTDDAQLQSEVMTALAQAANWVRERNRLEGHSNYVQGVSFSPDGNTIATASYDKTVKLWNRNGGLIRTLEGHTDSVMSVNFSPDGKTIASAGRDKVIKLWSTEGQLLNTLKGHTGDIYTVSFSPDSQRIASAGEDKTIRLWNRNGQLRKTLKGHSGDIWSVSLSPDGQTIASASYDKTVKLWTSNGALRQTLTGHTDAVWGVSFSPDSQTLITTSEDRTVRLWKSNGVLQKILRGHTETVKSVSFSRDGKFFATASADNTIKIWNREGNLLTTLAGHRGEVNGISFSSDSNVLASASHDTTVKLWQVNFSWLTVLDRRKGAVYGVAFSPDSQTIATASDDNTANLWSQSGQLLQTLEGHSDSVFDVSFSPDGQRIATVSGDRTIRLWNRQGQLLKKVQGHADTIFGVNFSPDGQILATASRDKTAKLWSLQGKLLQTIKGHQNWVYSATFSPDGQLIATAGKDNTVRLWNRDGQAIDTVLKHDSSVYKAVFSSMDQTIATAGQDNTAKLWSFDGKERSLLRGHAAGIWSMSFSPNGQMIATASDDKTIKLWNREGRLILTLIGHDAEVNNLSFSPDGRAIVSGSADGRAILWNVENLSLDGLLKQGCASVKDYLQMNDKAPSHLCDGIKF